MICFRNALIWAIIGGSFEIVKLIVDQQNVLLFEKDVDGKYILYQRKQLVTMQQFFVFSPDFRTALDWSLFANHQNVADLLVKYNATISPE